MQNAWNRSFALYPAFDIVQRQGYLLILMESCSSFLISKYCLGIFTVCFSLLFSLRKFEKQTYFRKPRGEVFLINSSIWILKRNFKSNANIGGISLMFQTLVKKSQMKSDEPTINIKTFWYFIAGSSPFILGDEFQTMKFCVSTSRFWAIKLGDEPATNL